MELRSLTILQSLILLLLLASPSAPAQQNDATPNQPVQIDQPLSKEAVRDLVSRLGDDQVRNLLIERLDAVAEREQQGEESSAVSVVISGFDALVNRAVHSFQHSGKIPEIIGNIQAAVAGSLPDGGAKSLLILLLLAGVVGLLAERAVSFLLRKRKQSLINAVSTRLWGILRILYTRLSFDVLGVFAFFIASSMIINRLYPPSYAHGFATAIKMGVFAAWLAYVIGRFFFAPSRPDLRICKTSDKRAWQLTISFTILAGYIVLMHNLFYLFMAVSVRQYGGFEYMWPFGFFLNLSMYLAAIGTIWYNREALSEVLDQNRLRISQAIGAEVSEEPGWFAIRWPKIAIVLIIAKYLLVQVIVNTSDVAVYSTAAVYTTFIVIFLWPGIDANISLFVGRGIRVPEDETVAAGNARRKMQQGLLRVGRVLVVCAVLLALARLWGLDIMHLAESGLGAQTAAKLIGFVFIILMAYVLWELVSILVGRWLALEGGAIDAQAADDDGGVDAGASMSRVATLLPIIQATSKFIILIVAIIMILDTMGLNIGPILAGASVIGLAVGFGAQTLVKDIVSGMFFLADDAFRVGETIDAGGTQGAVEKISLRSLRLRHHEGLVHTIPYGEIPQVTNYSRDWAILKLRFRVPFDTDVNKVKKIFKKIGQEMMQDPVIGPDFLQPFKSQGVAEVDDNGIVVRGKFMATPGKQYSIRKEVYVRVQKAFDEAGIPFARKQVMVHIPGLENGNLSATNARTIAAAAADSIDDAPVAPAKPRPGD